MAPTRRTYQADIAEQLGVSVSTVSRALANESRISESVRRDVQRAARALGYKSRYSNTVAGGRRAVALVPLGVATSGWSDFYFGLVEGLREAAATADLVLDVRLLNEAAVTLELIKSHVEQTGADGILLAGIDAWDELAAWSRDAGLPMVLVNGSDPMMQISSVSPSNFYGAYLATQRLLNAGHRKILHYSHRFRPTILQRRRGFEAAIAATPGAIGTVVNTVDCDTKTLLDDILSGRHDVSAMFSWNDIAPVEMLEGLHGDGRVLPSTFSIIGFDDLPVAGMTTPRLSTMRVDRDAIARGAIRLLHQHLDGETAVQQLEVAVTAVEGETIFKT